MRKRIAILMAGVLLTTAFAGGCGKAESPGTEATQTVAQAATETVAEVEITTETEAANPYDVIPKEFAYSLTVSINPLVELYFDAQDTVIGVAYLNQDAIDAYQELELVGKNMEDGMDLLVTTAVDKGYLKEDGTVDIELAKIGTQEKEIDSSILTNASKTVNQTLSAKNEEEAAPIQAAVEVNVTKEVEEETGVVTPSVCPTCNGTGKSCSICGGTGNCDECKGDGYLGNGYTVSCPRCHGSNTETCIYCDSAGNSNKHEGTCDFPNCMGSHVYACTTCGGGSRAVTCASCGGSGHCKTCGGNASCSTCGGSGFVN